jgi:hypothetical protein
MAGYDARNYGRCVTEKPKDLEEAEARNRRERPRMSDITRAVDKAEQGQAEKITFSDKYPYVDKLLNGSGSLRVAVDSFKEQNSKSCGTTEKTLDNPIWYNETTPSADKNTPTSLKQLRWAIYEAVDNHHARTSSTDLNKKIEDLFKEYTDS